jgi:hypothetical protein
MRAGSEDRRDAAGERDRAAARQEGQEGRCGSRSTQSDKETAARVVSRPREERRSRCGGVDQQDEAPQRVGKKPTTT